MLWWTIEVALAADGAIVLSRGLLQVDTEPGALCNMDRANIFDNARPVDICLNSLADLEFGHAGVAAARLCVDSAA
jgi:hypothetical protein